MHTCCMYECVRVLWHQWTFCAYWKWTVMYSNTLCFYYFNRGSHLGMLKEWQSHFANWFMHYNTSVYNDILSGYAEYKSVCSGLYILLGISCPIVSHFHTGSVPYKLQPRAVLCGWEWPGQWGDSVLVGGKKLLWKLQCDAADPERKCKRSLNTFDSVEVLLKRE